ncbi:uncharacterized protein LOC129916514 [Episyrphus balteatus]|uniref:uncharacterized protein LOC129916514 n=1 Tax=Episyrphus balteatus TaxID=286459 RepID=UPI002486C682|nr:uncharacterized protein LOC129916514 [Episyrphus balteatus]
MTSGENCTDEECSCSPNFYYDSFQGNCTSCPGFNQPCFFEACCASDYLVCYKGFCQCQNGINSISCSYIGPTNPFYFTASQIALSAALIMGMAALSMVVYRLCTKPRYLSARQRALASQMGLNMENENLSYANYLRASLTSMQIRVLSRMRDRPPTYDNRPTPAVPLEAPPPYEGNSEGIALPPPYMEVLVNSNGYTNSTFIDPEPGGVNSRNTVCPNCDNNQHRIESDCDKNETREENHIRV